MIPARWVERLRGDAPRHGRPLLRADGSPGRGLDRWRFDISYPVDLTVGQAYRRLDRYDVQLRPDGTFSYRSSSGAMQVIGRVEPTTERTSVVRAKAGRSLAAWIELLVLAAAIAALPAAAALVPFLGADALGAACIVAVVVPLGLIRAGWPLSGSPDEITEEFRQMLRPGRAPRVALAAAEDPAVVSQTTGRALWGDIRSALRRRPKVRVVTGLPADDALDALREAIDRSGRPGRAGAGPPIDGRVARRAIRIRLLGSGDGTAEVSGHIESLRQGSRLDLRWGIAGPDRVMRLVGLLATATIAIASVVSIPFVVVDDGLVDALLLAPVGVLCVGLSSGLVVELARIEASRRRGPDLPQIVADIVQGEVVGP